MIIIRKLLLVYIVSASAAIGTWDAIAQDWWAACSTERQRLCADIPSGGGRIAACISEHYDHLSASCRAAVPPPRQGNARTAEPPAAAVQTSSPAPQVTAERRPAVIANSFAGPYQVRGRTIVDGTGKVVRFRGINSSGLEFGNGVSYQSSQCGKRVYGCYHTHSAQEYANSARNGFNLVRLPLGWANIEPTAPDGSGRHQYNEAYLREVDASIQLARQAGLPVMISFHSNNWSSAYSQGGGMPSWLYPNKGNPQAAFESFLANESAGQDHYISMLGMMARRYASQDTLIGIDVYNEPRFQPQSRQQAVVSLQSFYDKAAVAIRAQNSRVLLVFQDFVDRDPQLTKFPAQSGVVYSFHSYGPWAGARGQSALAHVAHANRLGVPTFIGEFGKKNGPDWKRDMTDFLSSVRRDEVSWALFAYQFYEYPLYGQFGDGPLDEELLATVRTGF